MPKLTSVPIILAAVSACQPPASSPGADLNSRIGSIETATGGRLGISLMEADGRFLAEHRGDERFAFCSTFKLLLAGMALSGSRDGAWALDERLPVTREDVVVHSPVVQQHLQQGSISVLDAARAAVVVSDNAAANILIRRMGGLERFNQWLRSNGDTVTRLDRFEPFLNENRPNDPRDSSTPKQMARGVAQLVFGDRLNAADRDTLRSWLVESESGRQRIRAGLPPTWKAGDKTGSCSEPGRESYNDIAFIEPRDPSGKRYILAIFLDRPKTAAPGANAAIADVARAASDAIISHK